MSDPKTKDDHIIDFIKAFAQYEYMMEPYKEGKRDLRKSYKDNDYLTADEIRQAIRAYRVIQQDINLDELQSMRELLTKQGIISGS